jgi:uncharacterized membrane protein YeaQ/YmgE (transglycosylase-associated protein family)
MNWIAWIILGGLAGWAANMLTGNRGGIIRNVIIGIAGAVIGSWIMGALDKSQPLTFSLTTFLVAVGGAVVLLFVANFLSGKR